MGRLRLVDRATVARYGAPLAFLAAVTIAVLLVRSALHDSGPPTPPPVAAEAPAKRSRQPVARFYRVRLDDTLQTIAERVGTTPERLQALNPGIEPTALRIGQRIRVR